MYPYPSDLALVPGPWQVTPLPSHNNIYPYPSDLALVTWPWQVTPLLLSSIYPPLTLESDQVEGDGTNGPINVVNDSGYRGYGVESKALVVAMFSYTVELAGAL